MSLPKFLRREGAVYLVIDIQDSLLSKCVNREALVREVVKFAKFSRIMNIPAILTEQYPKGLGATNPAILQALEGVKPIEKTAFSCFGSTEFEKRLAELKAKSLILTGIEAHICVSQTALEALGRGYDVFLLADGVSSRTEDNRRIGIERVRDAGGAVVSVEMAIYEIMRDAAIPEFRSVLQLVK